MIAITDELEKSLGNLWRDLGNAKGFLTMEVSTQDIILVVGFLIALSKELNMHGIGWAIEVMKGGGRVCRAGWNGKGQSLELQVPDENSKMTLPYVFINTVQGDRVPWLCSQTDLLATDWEVAE